MDDAQMHYLSRPNGLFGVWQYDCKITKKLKQEIEEAAAKQEYEKAAYLRDKMIAIENISQKQKVSNINENSIDVIGIAKNETGTVCIEMFFVRQSKMIGRKNYLYNNLEDTDTKEILTEFVKQYYIKNENVPSKIMISEEILDKDIFVKSSIDASFICFIPPNFFNNSCFFTFPIPCTSSNFDFVISLSLSFL